VKAFLVAISLGAWWGAPARQPQAAESEVVAVVQKVFEGMRRSDSALVRPLFHPKARLITVDARRPGVRIEESAEQFIGFVGTARSEVLDEQLFNVRTNIDGGVASVWADYKLYRGTTFIHCGIDHFLLVKEDGAWRIIELADTRRTTNC
jgi:hypothetical protein